MRALSLSYNFEVEIDDIKVRVSNRPGDVMVLRAQTGGGNHLDEALTAGGTSSYEVLFRFAWRALTHADGYATITWEEFCDRCTSWSMIDDERVRPTVAGPSSAP